jgi:uncharacterized protein YecE (DUF72 family)
MFHGYGIILVNIDQPVISLSLGPTAYVTNPEMTYLRLHGRNYQTWFGDHGRDQRYHYDYQAGELEEIRDNVLRLGKKAEKVFISGNNHYKGNAVQNLLALKKLL